MIQARLNRVKASFSKLIVGDFMFRGHELSPLLSRVLITSKMLAAIYCHTRSKPRSAETISTPLHFQRIKLNMLTLIEIKAKKQMIHF